MTSYPSNPKSERLCSSQTYSPLPRRTRSQVLTPASFQQKDLSLKSG